MSGEKVVALPGYSIPTPHGQPVKSVVEILREYLAKAESGSLRAVLVAGVEQCGVTDSETINGDFAAAAGLGWSLGAAAGNVLRRYEKWIDG